MFWTTSSHVRHIEPYRSSRSLVGVVGTTGLGHDFPGSSQPQQGVMINCEIGRHGIARYIRRVLILEKQILILRVSNWCNKED